MTDDTKLPVTKLGNIVGTSQSHSFAETDPEKLCSLALEASKRETQKPPEDQNFAEAIELAGKAADQGSGRAMDMLGFFYSLRGYETRDYVLAHMWYNLAAEYVQHTDYWWMRDQIIKSAHWLAGMMTPSQISKAEELAREWKPSTTNRGSDGLGSPKPDITPGSALPAISARDDAAIIKYREAAERGDATAQFYLGEAYHEGDGVAQSDLDAVKWWRRAADQGHAAAQHQLGYAYWDGDGVSKNLIMAHVWFSLSWEEPIILAPRVFYSPAADELIELLEKSMTPPEIDEARRLLQGWTANSEKAAGG